MENRGAVFQNHIAQTIDVARKPSNFPRGRVPLPVGRAGFKPVGGRAGVFGRFDSCLFRPSPISGRLRLPHPRCCATASRTRPRRCSRPAARIADVQHGDADAVAAHAAGDLTAHGFGSTFSDWAAERTGYPREVVEMALAHAVANKVEGAYRRGDLFEKRRQLAEVWARFCAAPV